MTRRFGRRRRYVRYRMGWIRWEIVALIALALMGVALLGMYAWTDWKIDWAAAMVVLQPIVAVATLVGIVVALLQFQVTIRSRRSSLAAARFDHTIEAYRFFQNDVIKSIDGTTKTYRRALRNSEYEKFKGTNLGDLIALRKMKSANFGLCFRKLNVLESYIFYDTINKYQLYSSIGDEIYEFMQIDDFEIAKAYLLEERVMNNYVSLLDDVRDYVERRRIKHGK